MVGEERRLAGLYLPSNAFQDNLEIDCVGGVSDQVLDRDDVFMGAEVAQQFDLPQDALG